MAAAANGGVKADRSGSGIAAATSTTALSAAADGNGCEGASGSQTDEHAAAEFKAAAAEVAGCGHAVHLERPEALALLLQQFLQQD